MLTADDDSCSSYDSVSPTDLTVGTTNTVTAIATDIDTSSCDPDNVFYLHLRIGRAVLWHLLLTYIMKSSVHQTTDTTTYTPTDTATDTTTDTDTNTDTNTDTDTDPNTDCFIKLIQ